MIILRVFPKGDVREAWDNIAQNMKTFSSENSTPLYLSQQEEKNFLSIIYDVKDVDLFCDILVKKISSVLQPEKTRTVTLLKPVFFPAPKDRSANLERYQVAVRVTSDELENVFSHILHLNYPRDVFPTYAAYSFGEDDILTSMLSTSRDTIKKFVRENLELQKGVARVEVARINMSKRVAPTEMWKKYRESKYVFKPAAEHEEYDFLEHAALSGAFVQELEGAELLTQQKAKHQCSLLEKTWDAMNEVVADLTNHGLKVDPEIYPSLRSTKTLITVCQTHPRISELMPDEIDSYLGFCRGCCGQDVVTRVKCELRNIEDRLIVQAMNELGNEYALKLQQKTAKAWEPLNRILQVGYPEALTT